MNAFLFMIRAHAVFKQEKKPRILLTGLWFTTFLVFVCPSSFIFASEPIQGYCPAVEVKKIGLVGPIALAIFDTLIFVSITWSIISFTREDSTFRGTFRFYKYGGRVAQLLLSTGHLYFM